MHNLNSILEGGGYKYAGIKFYNGPYNKKHEVIPGDVIVANTEQTWERVLIGYPAIVPSMLGDKGIYSHHIYRVRPENSAYLTKSFIYFMIWEEGLRDWISRFANGTTINMLPREGLSFPKIPMPPNSLVKEFSEFVEPTLTVMENLFQKNQNLRTTRDLLLPKLISGEIDVEELDINTGQLYAEA
jgi:type I restriction enzyme S subunit